MEAVRYKLPLSVLVVIYSSALDVLLLRRVHDAPDGQPFWQSVTGAKDTPDEPWAMTVQREVLEETGIDCQDPAVQLQDWGLENNYPIYPQWLHRYAPGVWCNVERVFGLCVGSAAAVRLSAREHSDHVWLPWREAADKCYSASNAEAILQLPQRVDCHIPKRRF